MDAALAAPFLLGAGSVLLSDYVQKLLAHQLEKDHRAAVHDGSGNKYKLPPALEEAPTVRRFSRDADALGAVTYCASTLSAALVLFDTKSVGFGLAVGIAVLLPVVALAILLRTDPLDYELRAVCRGRVFSVSPFVYWAVPLSLVVALLAALCGVES